MSSTPRDKTNRSLEKNSLILSLFLSILLLASATPIHPPVHPFILEGIEILFETEPRMFPPNWYCKRIDAQAVSLPKSFRKEAMDILNRAIAKYPEDVLFVYLRKVYVLRSMSFFGVPYGGTNSKDVVYLTYDNANPDRAAEYVEGVFHHEFSSVLLRKFSKFLDKRSWEAMNPTDFTYGEGGVEAIRNGNASLAYDYDLLELGFLNKYSQSGLEEDINVFAQHLFSGGEQFWQITDTFARIHEKVSLIIRFYQQIDPRFTEEYFRGLARSP